MRNRGGKKMQVLDNKYRQKMERKENSPSERFDVRVKIAHQVTRDVIVLNDNVYQNIVKKTMRQLYGRERKR